MLLRKQNKWKAGAGQPLTRPQSCSKRPPTTPVGILQPQPQVGEPVGEHPVDANVSTMLQNLLYDLAKDNRVQPFTSSQ